MTFEARKLLKKIFFKPVKACGVCNLQSVNHYNYCSGEFPVQAPAKPPAREILWGCPEAGGLGKLLADWLSSVARKACNSPPKHPGEAFVVPL